MDVTCLESICEMLHECDPPIPNKWSLQAAAATRSAGQSPGPLLLTAG